MLIKNCKIFSPTDYIHGDILVHGEKIARVARSLKARGEDVVNVRGRQVIPGLVDPHVHLRDFREKHKEDVVSGTRAALAGGVTSLLEMPNTQPSITSSSQLQRRERLLKRKACCDFATRLGIAGGWGGEGSALAKIYLDGTLGEVSDGLLERAVKKLSSLAVHAESGEVIMRGRERFREHAKVRAPEAEISAVKKVAMTAEKYKKKVHLCHLSTAKALDFLNEHTSSEVTPHHLFLNTKHARALGGLATTNPPLRSVKDNSALWKALRDGRVDMLASDHAPHRLEEKEGEQPPPGVPNLEVSLKLLLTMVKRGTISLSQVVRWCSCNPARAFGLEQKGSIEPGKHADLVVVDMKKEGKIEPEHFYSKAKYSPFDGWRYMGDVSMVFLRGKKAFEDGEVAHTRGRALKFL